MGRGEGPRKSMFAKRHATALPRVKPARSVGVIAGEPYNMVWVVSSLRKDKKTGVLDPVPQDPYAELLYESCFKKWREEDEGLEPSTT
ncbi:hypothetical protein OCF11_16890 [Bacillus cereus]|nr:hypothetical protein [Bacillus cereus]